MKSKPKPVRKALEARYDAISEAYRLKDPDTVLRMRTEGFHAIPPSGQIWDAAASAQYTRAGFAQAETTLVATFGIGTIDVHGDTAAAEIDQHWVRRQQKAGALRLVDTRAHQRETWVRRDGAWLLWRVDHVNPGPWIVDGKQIDPSKSYDPNAPAYEPCAFPIFRPRCHACSKHDCPVASFDAQNHSTPAPLGTSIPTKPRS